MLEKDATLGNIKHEVLYRVAQLAYDGLLDEHEDQIPYQIIPGPQANFRCCVYKEREIVRERIRLARGLEAQTGLPCKNTVQVISAACEGCPITRFVVTDNCQKCMAKKCQQACNFGAITMMRDRAYIDPMKCKECGRCHDSCPYNAIADLVRPCKKSCPVNAISMDENNLVVIDEEKCIRCGQCIKNCPFGAISDYSRMTEVIDILRDGSRPVYAIVAPAVEGQFGANVTIAVLREAVKKLGFTDLVEVSLGGDYVAYFEAEEWAEAYKDGKKMTTSCCPAFVNMIRRHFPEVQENMSTTVSPMAAVARLLRAKEPNAVSVFFGPCIAKKSEVANTEDNADFALTFEELNAMLRARNVELSSFEKQVQQGSIYGKRFANAGGVTKAVVESLTEQGENTNIKVRQCNGAKDCKNALMMLKLGRLPEDFIEGMCCEGGCVNGPGSIKVEPASKKDRETLLSQADARNIKENLDHYADVQFSMHRK
jgi:ferredoxin hydrogenase large subunit